MIISSQANPFNEQKYPQSNENKKTKLEQKNIFDLAFN